jgi:hypothetical protein
MDQLVPALRVLARDIVCEDGVATTVILQAADEIERLREANRPLGDPEIAVEILRLRVAELEEAIRRATLTDAEREAVATAAASCEGIGFDQLPATLRGLLERLK